MEIKTLTGIDIKDILDVFNSSFSDYFIPFHLSQEQLISKMKADTIDLNLSVGAFENNKLIGFILHGAKEVNGHKVLYNGGTGVIPNKRGAGLTKQMHLFILPILKAKNINSLFLEVISENIQAIKSYEHAGYKKVRELLCYKGTVENLEINNNIVVKDLNNHKWELIEPFWDITPTWQNSKNTIDSLLDSTISIGAYFQNKLIGYVVYNPTNKRLQQLGVAKNHRQKKVASTLIWKLKQDYGPSFSIINVDESSKSTNAFLENIGLEKTLKQYEMKLILNL